MCFKRVGKKKLLGRNSMDISHLCEMTVAKCVHETQKK